MKMLKMYQFFLIKSRFLSVGFLTLLLSLASLRIAQAQSALTDPGKPKARPDALLYRVAPGEHLAEILRRMGYQNIWGPKGMVARVKEANRETTANADILTPGTWIYIPSTLVPNQKLFIVTGGEVRTRATAETAIQPVTPPVAEVSTRLKIQCPDGSFREAGAHLIKASVLGDPPTLVVDQPEGLCAEPKPAPSPAAPIPPVVNTPEPPSMTPEKVKGEPEDSSTAPIKTAPPKIEADSASDSPPRAATNAIGHSPSTVYGDLIGGGGFDSLQLSGAGGSPNLSGFNYGARVGYAFQPRAVGFLIDLTYRQAQLTDPGGNNDFVTLNMLEYGIGFVWDRWALRLGRASNSLTDASRIQNFNVSDAGWYTSLAYRFPISRSFSLGVEGHVAIVTYTAANNPALGADANSVQSEALITVGYRLDLD